jgi:dihydropteroate synthase
MGIVNVTPDSFSDGGRFQDHDAAIQHGLDLVSEGADLVDVGGESTRPGASPVDPVEEQRRVLPVITALAASVRVSVDTRHAATAQAAIEAGATIINDVSASLWAVAAEAGAGWIAMHMQGEPGTMQLQPAYDDVVAEVTDFLVERAEVALAAGVDELWIDPGFGFGKDAGHNLELLANLDVLVARGYPVCVGLSRKAFLGRLLAASDRAAEQPALPGLDGPVDLAELTPVPTDARLEGSLATAVWAIQHGAAMVRVHDVKATADAVRLVAA